MTTNTRQLQQYTRSTNNSYTKDNLKLATKHTRQIRILQHVHKVKIPEQESTVYRYDDDDDDDNDDDDYDVVITEE